MPIISAVNLSKSFGKKTVLKEVNFDVEEGQSLVILGGSCSGKTVLLRCIMGLLHPDQGYVEVNGNLIGNLNKKQLYEANKSIGMCFQMAPLFDSMTVDEPVRFALLPPPN